MLLKDLINQLQSLYDKEVVGDYLEVIGESYASDIKGLFNV